MIHSLRDDTDAARLRGDRPVQRSSPVGPQRPLPPLDTAAAARAVRQGARRGLGQRGPGPAPGRPGRGGGRRRRRCGDRRPGPTADRAGRPGGVLRGGRADGAPPGPYDVITCLATIHHLPFGEALRLFRRHLAPGGTLVVVGLAQAQTPGDHLLGAAAIPLNAALGWIKNKGRTAPRPPSMTAPTRPAGMGFRAVVREAGAVLPGARLRRRLFWRYTLVWRAV